MNQYNGNIIDIHTHILPFVDHGTDGVETSLEMLRKEAEAGVSDVILTPHFGRMFKIEGSKDKEIFLDFKQKVKEAGIPINVYLGQEVYAVSDVREKFKKGITIPIENTKYILLEFPTQDEIDISEIVYEAYTSGYIPIVAHYERYIDASPETAEEIHSCGGLIQVNAGSIVGERKGIFKRRIKRLFKANQIDFIASDFHCDREFVLKECADYVNKKYGKEVAERLFYLNAKKIIEGQQ